MALRSTRCTTAPRRIDSFGAFWFSPLDMVGWTVLFSLCLTLGVGLHGGGEHRGAAGDDVPLGVPAQQPAHAALARLRRAAAGEPLAPPRAGRARAQLFGSAALRPAVRHLPQPARLRRRERLLRRRVGAGRRDAALSRRVRAAARRIAADAAPRRAVA
ncbi:MAG: hypothetical protein MZW92_51875 [Comamonadaceae bacterium]|nr:hypothetical protein [Comamonadaceae bacterium]